MADALLVGLTCGVAQGDVPEEGFDGEGTVPGGEPGVDDLEHASVAYEG